jgi:hypothetical protein
MPGIMDNTEFQLRLRAGVGGPRLWRLRKRTAIKTARDFIEVGTLMSRLVKSDQVPVRDAIHAVGLLLQMVGELAYAAGRMLSDREYYSGAALLRQVVEIECLTWTFQENSRSPAEWLESTHEKRMKDFSPAQLRQTSKVRFLSKDYRDHGWDDRNEATRYFLRVGRPRVTASATPP